MMRSGGNDPSSHGSKHREQEDEEWKPRSADVPVASAQGEKEDEDEGNDHANEHEDDEDDEGTEESTRIIIRGTNAVSVRSSSSISANTASSSTSTTSAAATATGSGEMSNMKLPFPWKLHTLLEDAEHAGQQDIVSWLPDGNGFKVHKPNEFCQVIMPKYFRQSKYESFTRQLYIYGFSKIELKGPSQGGFSHPYFVKDNRALCLSLGRNRAGDRRRKKPPISFPATRTAGDYNNHSSATAAVPFLPYHPMFQRPYPQQQQQEQQSLLGQRYSLPFPGSVPSSDSQSTYQTSNNRIMMQQPQQPLSLSQYSLSNVGSGSSSQQQHHQQQQQQPVNFQDSLSPIRSTRLLAATNPMMQMQPGSALLDAATRLLRTGSPSPHIMQPQHPQQSPPGGGGMVLNSDGQGMVKKDDSKVGIKSGGQEISGTITDQLRYEQSQHRQGGTASGPINDNTNSNLMMVKWGSFSSDGSNSSRKNISSGANTDTCTNSRKRQESSSRPTSSPSSTRKAEGDNSGDAAIWELLEPRPIEEMIARPIQKNREKDC